jgi:hypothetical protein
MKFEDYMDSYEHLHSHLNGFFIIIFIRDISQGLNTNIYIYIYIYIYMNSKNNNKIFN